MIGKRHPRRPGGDDGRIMMVTTAGREAVVLTVAVAVAATAEAAVLRAAGARQAGGPAVRAISSTVRPHTEPDVR